MKNLDTQYTGTPLRPSLTWDKRRLLLRTDLRTLWEDLWWRRSHPQRDNLHHTSANQKEKKMKFKLKGTYS